MVQQVENELILNLAKAYALLAYEADHFMPKAAVAQRTQVMDTLQLLIDDALTHDVAVSETPPQTTDAISRTAQDYLEQRKQKISATSATQRPAYQQLKDLFAQRSMLFDAMDLVYWLESTQSLDASLVAKKTFSQARTALESISHRLIAKPEIRQWLDAARHDPALSEADQRNLDLMEQQWLEAAGLDPALVANLSNAIHASNDAWVAAKASNRFEEWLPHFETLVGLVRQKGEAMGAFQHVSPYQALLGSLNFNPGLHNETVNRMFDELRVTLPSLIQQISKKQALEPAPLPLPAVPVALQERAGKRIMQTLGLDEAHARLDTSVHPFSCGQYDDVRITTRYDPNHMLSALMGIIHETGHALYSRAQPRAWHYQPVGAAQSSWVHESQSLFWEYQVMASPAFMEFLSPILKQELGVDGPEWSPENLHKLVTRVKPGLIRYDADEVTYCTHILLRHDLEQKLIDGRLKPKDLPEAWNKGMYTLLGVIVPDDARGCMQDTHWSEGDIGYFPAYAFGILGAAQLMDKMKQDIPDLDSHIRQGDFAPLRQWLATHVHEQGSRYDGEALIEKATGTPLSTDAFFKHITDRYLATPSIDSAGWAQRNDTAPGKNAPRLP